MYLCQTFAANDHQELQRQINAWLQQERPPRVHQVELTADGSVYTYVAIFVYVTTAKGQNK
jgi:predicted DNA-binding protein (UPF0278 family)